MQNLEQIRAANALKALNAPANTNRTAVSKLPAMILANGLLATAAFCEAGTESRKEMKIAMDHTAGHLADRGLINQVPGKTVGLIADLSGGNSLRLQRATAEALAFISYLKRFAKQK